MLVEIIPLLGQRGCDGGVWVSVNQSLPREYFEGNLNNLKTPGIYYCVNACQNTPTGYGGLLIVGGSSSLLGQFYVALGSTDWVPRARLYSSGSWGSWYKVVS